MNVNFEIILKAQSGDPKSSTIVFTKARTLIMSVLIRTFQQVERETIEDVAQESLIKVFKNLHKYEPNFSLGSWVGTIARNTMIDYLRKGKLKEVSLDYDNSNEEQENSNVSLSNLVVCHNLTAEELLINNDRKTFINKLLENNTISLNIREVAKMIFIDGMSYKEISEQKNIPLGTVKARIFRFREMVANLVTSEQKEEVY